MMKTISVTDMGSMLGLKKTESYYLIHQNYFTTHVIAGKYRVDVDSFEDWYSKQYHYKKVNGDPPGQALRKTLSPQEIADTLECPIDTVYSIIKRGEFITEKIDGKIRVDEEGFNEWYWKYIEKTINKTSDYNNLPYYTPNSIAKMLGISISTSYYLLEKSDIKCCKTGEVLIVNKDYFEEWYSRQFRYKKVDGDPPGMAFGPTISIEDAATRLNISKQRVRILLKDNRIKSYTDNRIVRIDKDDFEKYIISISEVN